MRGPQVGRCGGSRWRRRSLKQRIRGRHGHLSNEEAYDFLTQDRGAEWKHIFLAHLSVQCNDVEKLEALYANAGLPVTVVDPLGSKIEA